MLWGIVLYIVDLSCNGSDEPQPDSSLNDVCDEFNIALDEDMLGDWGDLMNTQIWIAHIGYHGHVY